MEQTTSVLMERTGKIIRRSIHTLLKDFHHFTSNPAIVMLPFSASILVLLSLYRSCSQTKSLFHDARISFLDLRVSQMIFSYVFSLPFALSSLVIAKAAIIQHLNHHKSTLSLFCSTYISLYKPVVLTYLCNIVLIITINTATFFFLFRALSFFEELFGLSSNNPFFNLAAGIVFYIFFTNTVVICNLALVIAGMGNCAGYMAIWKVYLLSKSTKSIALLLAIPINLGLTALEALFRYRVVRAYQLFGRPSVSMVLEGLLIAYLFSLLIVLDTIASFLFIKSCESNFGREQAAELCYIEIEFGKEDDIISARTHRLEELP